MIVTSSPLPSGGGAEGARGEGQRRGGGGVNVSKDTGESGGQEVKLQSGWSRQEE